MTLNRRRLVSGRLPWALSAALLVGCASAPTPADCAAEKPVLDLKTYFNGELTAHGIFTDRAGKVVHRFTVQMTGSWQGQQGTLDERFTYSDGKTERRIWRLTDEGGGRWLGRADDVVGVAEGRLAGNALNWRYTLALPVDGKTYEVQFDDWMYLMDQRARSTTMALNPKIDDWTGRSVWIVGASSGIGHATAELLHAKGARVCVSARSAASIW